MRRLVLLLGIFQLGWQLAAAQGVSGRVVNVETGEALAGVNIIVEDTHQGSITDEQGTYDIRLDRAGEHTLLARFIGFHPQRRQVNLRAGERVVVNFALRPEVLELDQVEVVAERGQALSDTRTSILALEPRHAQLLPGASEDVMRALQAMPGVVAANDFSAQLIVRGGGPDENLIILDNVEVFNPYRLYGVVSMFNPVVVSDITLATGGFPARYGDRLSSVLDVSVRDGAADRRLGGSLNTSIANSNLVLEGQTGFLDGSWLLTGRRTYYDLVLGLVARGLNAVDEDIQFPNFADLQGKLVLRPASGHRLQFNGILSRDALDIAAAGGEPDAGSEADRFAAEDFTRNDLAGGAWHWAPTPEVLSMLTVSWYRNGGTFGTDGRVVPRDRFEGDRFVASTDTTHIFEFSYDQSFLFRKFSIAQQTVWQYRNHFIEAGTGVDLLDTGLHFDLRMNEVGRAFLSVIQNAPWGPGAFPEQFSQSKDYYRYHFYAQDRVALWNERLYLQPGLRFDYYRIIDRSYVSPRFNLSLAVDPETTLRAAWGVYRQSPGFEKLIDGSNMFDFSEEAGIETLQAESAVHYVAGISRAIGPRYHLRTEVYFKTFDNLIVQDYAETQEWLAVHRGGAPVTHPDAYEVQQRTTRTLVPTPVNDSRGRAYGMELMLERSPLHARERLSGWLSYAYAYAYRSRLVDDGERWIQVPFNYDRRHVANLVVNYRPGKGWLLGATLRYGTGFPYTPPVGYRPMLIRRVAFPPAGTEMEVFTDASTGLVRFRLDYGDEENINSARLPDYRRLDIRVSRDLVLWGLDWQFYLDVINLENRSNIAYYAYRALVDPAAPENPPAIMRSKHAMFPILPTLGFNINF